MSLPDKHYYFSRLTMKFVEIVVAGVATAVSGYLVAHLGGFFSSPPPLPAAAQVAPSAGVMPKGVSSRGRTEPAPPIAADANAQHVAPPPHVNSGAMEAAQTTANAAQAAPARKHLTPDASAAEGKPREAESVAAQVRAALANVDANRPTPPDAAAHQADLPTGSPAIKGPVRPADGRTGIVAVTPAPRGGDVAPQPLPQAPVPPDPLTAVEIKSRPIVAVEPSPSPRSVSSAEDGAQAADTDLFSAIKKIPGLLRSDPPTSPDEAPRPPLPVGH